MINSIAMIEKILKMLTGLQHRYSTTENEARACELLKKELDELGIKSAIEPFLSPTTFSWTYFIIYFGMVLSLLISLYFNLTGLLLFFLFIIFFIGEQTTLFPLISNFLPKKGSQNLVGTIKEGSKGSKIVYLVAHYDSSKTSIAFAPYSTRFIKPLFKVSLSLIFISLLVLILRLKPELQDIFILRLFLILSLIYFLYMALMMLERELRGVPVEGAADNASGVAIVMELARRFSQKKDLAQTELRVLLTGCEEVGMVGMSAFLKKHKKELDKKRTYFINFDSIGKGTLAYITKEGMIYPLRADKELLEIAKELSSEEEFKEIKGLPYTALTLDTLVPRSRGYKVISMMALNEFLVPAPWHWFDDTIEQVDIKKLELCARFSEKMIDTLDRKSG